MQHATNDERGFALAAAVFALVIVGALVTAGFFAASQESRIGYSTQYAADAFFAAERGLNELVGSKTKAFYNDSVADDAIVEPAGFQVVQVVSDGVVSEFSVSVRGLGDQLFYVESTGRVTGGGSFGGAARRTGMVVRTFDLDFDADAALMSFGGVRTQGATNISGLDEAPAGWAGCPVGSDGPGVIAKDSSSVDPGNQTTLDGDPPVDQDTTMTEDDFLKYGGLDYDRLAAMADAQYQYRDAEVLNNMAPSYLSGGACNTFDGNNWGAPLDQTDACAGHFPLMHANGNLTVNSAASGQGILLVDGDLRLTGGFQFHGVVIVKGKLVIGSGGADLHGSVMIFNDGNDVQTNNLAGAPTFQFSSCAVERAVDLNAVANRAFPLGDRSWVDLTATGTLSY
ncbi:MAG: hypothetical protein ABFS34_04365 [Gemmatimonadota bacterium]